MMQASRENDRPAPGAAAPAGGNVLLGGRDPNSFLKRFWQKEALLIRAALPGFSGILTERDLFGLAARDDVESRLIVRSSTHWSLTQGPFRRRDLAALPARNWTLLVQGVNLHSRAADALLRRFAMLPYARLDDLMVSLAAPGGGVGPHFDSYDVFLLQGDGRRRWRYGRQADLALKPRLPVKILRRFAPQHDVVLGPGDMLYLPPHYAHDGIALDRCATYSIGFRAPSANELATAFLDFLRDDVDLAGRYSDPDLRVSLAPAMIGTPMRKRISAMLRGIRWDTETVGRFLGCWLTEPKATVFFVAPSPQRSRPKFLTGAATSGIRLDRRSQVLYDERRFFVNGDAIDRPAAGGRILERLANARSLGPREVAAADPDVAALLYDWYCHGYLHTDAR